MGRLAARNARRAPRATARAIAAATAAVLLAACTVHSAAVREFSTADCPLLIAHRGYTGGANGTGPVPANSAAAIGNAAEHGATVVEFDVRWSADDVPVVIHNATVNATTRRRGKVASYKAVTLEKMRLRSSSGVTSAYLPSLARMLRQVAREHVKVVIQIKTNGVTAAQAASFTAAIDRAGAQRAVSIHSFYPASLAALAVYPATLLTETPVTAAPGDVGVDLRGTTVTAALVTRLHAAGLTVGAWTSPGSGVRDDKATWARLAADGVDRIITNGTAAYARWCGRV
jgi:glycerophosphoryl diester phosphodiesterase